jgi:hypothetical protein
MVYSTYNHLRLQIFIPQNGFEILAQKFGNVK